MKIKYLLLTIFYSVSSAIVAQDVKLDEFYCSIETNVFVTYDVDYRVTAMMNECGMGFMILDNVGDLVYGTFAFGCDITLDQLRNQTGDEWDSLWGAFSFTASNENYLYLSTHRVIPSDPLDWYVDGDYIFIEFNEYENTYYIRFKKTTKESKI